MTAAQQLPLVSVEDYLAGERDAEVRHEYLGGYVYAMAGAKTVHNRIAANLLGLLHAQLRGKPCEPFGSDMKVRIPMRTHTRFYYPDGMVVCEPNGQDDPFQDKPVVIAEVLSSSTRRADQFEKRDAYLSIPSLAVYLLIETDRPEVAVYRRDTQGGATQDFQSSFYRATDAVIPLDEIECKLPLADLYERVEFSPPSP